MKVMLFIVFAAAVSPAAARAPGLGDFAKNFWHVVSETARTVFVRRGGADAQVTGASVIGGQPGGGPKLQEARAAAVFHVSLTSLPAHPDSAPPPPASRRATPPVRKVARFVPDAQQALPPAAIPSDEEVPIPGEAYVPPPKPKPAERPASVAPASAVARTASWYIRYGEAGPQPSWRGLRAAPQTRTAPLLAPTVEPIRRRNR